MKRSYLPLVLFFSIAVMGSACISSMKVKVDVIDRKKLITAPEVLLLEILAISEIEENRLRSQFYEKQRDDIVNAFERLLMRLVQNLNLSLDNKKVLSNALKLEIDNVYLQQLIPELSDAINITKSIFNEPPSKDGNLTNQQLDLLYQAKSKFNNARRIVNNLIMKWAKLEAGWMGLLKTIVNNSPQLSVSLYRSMIAPPLRSAMRANNQINYLEAFHNGLFNDPLNSFIIQAQNKYWKKIYNKTVANNFLGNADIAVVMETPGNFFIKGVRMDAENVTSTLASTFNASIKLLGKVNGLNFTSQGRVDTTGVSERKTLITEEINRRELEQEIEVREKITKLSLINIMDAIIAQKDSLNVEPGFRKALLQIKSIYKVHKLQLQTVQKN